MFSNFQDTFRKLHPKLTPFTQLIGQCHRLVCYCMLQTLRSFQNLDYKMVTILWLEIHIYHFRNLKEIVSF